MQFALKLQTNLKIPYSTTNHPFLQFLDESPYNNRKVSNYSPTEFRLQLAQYTKNDWSKYTRDITGMYFLSTNYKLK